MKAELRVTCMVRTLHEGPPTPREGQGQLSSASAWTERNGVFPTELERAPSTLHKLTPSLVPRPSA